MKTQMTAKTAKTACFKGVTGTAAKQDMVSLLRMLQVPHSDGISHGYSLTVCLVFTHSL